MKQYKFKTEKRSGRIKSSSLIQAIKLYDALNKDEIIKIELIT